MQLTIQIPSEVEGRLRDQAMQKGKDLTGYVQDLLSNSLPTADSQSASLVSEKESELLEQLQTECQGFSQEKAIQYKTLVEERREETISTSDLELLKTMSRELEIGNVQRMEILTKLSKIRNQPLRVVMQDLGIGSIDGEH